jgi:hypothetical protein
MFGKSSRAPNQHHTAEQEQMAAEQIRITVERVEEGQRNRRFFLERQRLKREALDSAAL